MNRTQPASFTPSIRVELRAARIPIIGFFAHHHWFVVDRGGVRDRWEVWQSARAGGTAWGHLHRNLKRPDAGVGFGPSWLVQMWEGGAAVALARRIEDSPQTYPWRGRYLPWPGPNSNTYVQWVLGTTLRLGPHAPGRNYARRHGRAPADPRTVGRALAVGARAVNV